MLDQRSVVVAGLVALASSLPGASARTVCTKTDAGEEVCRDTLPTEAKLAIAFVAITVLFLVLLVIFFVRRSRRAAAEAERECSVDDSQMVGPPTVLRATYNPDSGHSIYAIGSAGSPALRTSVIPPTASPQPGQDSSLASASSGTNPSWPPPSVAVPAAPYSPSTRGGQPMTAPAHRSTFSTSSSGSTGSGQQSPYPFSARGNAMGSSGQPPKSAFVSSGGFPRPLLAGRLKDRIRDRPPSISSLPNEFEVRK